MYVSMEATTTRASTVIRSMPTSDTRTQASMTMPLSRTRSRTSIRLVPPVVRSTGIRFLLPWLLLDRSARSARVRASSVAAPIVREQRDLFFERRELTLEVVGRQCGARSTRREVRVVLPPVETDLLRLVDGADDQADANREKFNLGERNFDVAGDGQSLVEHAVEDVDKATDSMLV